MHSVLTHYCFQVTGGLSLSGDLAYSEATCLPR